MLHVADISHGRVNKPSDALTIGQQLDVYQQNLDFAGATSIIIVILVIGIVVDTLFTKADLAIRRRRGLLEGAT